MSMEIPKFNSPQEEIAFWKKQVEDKQQDLDSLENNFTEYQEFSKQLEEEMERELKACEKKYADMQSQHMRLKNDHENILDKLNGVSKESSKLITNLQDEISKLQTTKQTLLEERRKLEQENDYLERRERASSASINDLTEKLDRVVEENVWMQSELEESKEAADETIQRLRDDIRDLRQELSVRERRKTTSIQGLLSKPPTTEKSKRENPLSMNIPRPTKSQRNRVEDNATSKRSGSLVIVQDLINMVSDLENKISNFKGQKSIVSSSPSPSSNSLTSSSITDPNLLATSPLFKSSNSLSNFSDIVNSLSSKRLNTNSNSLLNSFIEVQKNNSNNNNNNNINDNTNNNINFQNSSSNEINKQAFING
ncbi:Lis-interacting protein [Tieghemostelium lacteum]|uniref:Lis-interacting protein n=1 Tax=Tieghemostelium lacteum TaxID=361077 RepID=A0A151ZHV0_TIELA|nr:Lis-interacting protein [Tieghemostelium lacteum]|eukprot:KYQ93543.1 Lis-interacting protein [Tieghemostelium lacteum]